MIDYHTDIIPFLRNSQKLLITTHIHPDGDAAGSVMGLVHSLRKHGTYVDVSLSTEIGERFMFLFEGERIIPPAEITSNYNGVIILDIGSEDRTGFQEIIRALDCPIANIDHHATNTGFGDFDLLDIDASSTCEMIFYLLKSAELPIDKNVAEALYTGMLTDSRYFQNANVRKETFNAASGLLATGLDHRPIIRRLTLSRTWNDLKVLGIGLDNFETRKDGKIAFTSIRQHEFEHVDSNYRHAWSAGVFGYLISLKTAIVAVSFIEAPDRIFCEFRSKEGFDVSKIAAFFGGGGHKAASGCSVSGQFDGVVKTVISKLECEIEKFS